MALAHVSRIKIAILQKCLKVLLKRTKTTKIFFAVASDGASGAMSGHGGKREAGPGKKMGAPSARDKLANEPAPTGVRSIASLIFLHFGACVTRTLSILLIFGVLCVSSPMSGGHITSV